MFNKCWLTSLWNPPKSNVWLEYIPLFIAPSSLPSGSNRLCSPKELVSWGRSWWITQSCVLIEIGETSAKATLRWCWLEGLGMLKCYLLLIFSFYKRYFTSTCCYCISILRFPMWQLVHICTYSAVIGILGTAWVFLVSEVSWGFLVSWVRSSSASSVSQSIELFISTLIVWSIFLFLETRFLPPQ